MSLQIFSAADDDDDNDDQLEDGYYIPVSCYLPQSALAAPQPPVPPPFWNHNVVTRCADPAISGQDVNQLSDGTADLKKNSRKSKKRVPILKLLRSKIKGKADPIREVLENRLSTDSCEAGVVHDRSRRLSIHLPSVADSSNPTETEPDRKASRKRAKNLKINSVSD